MRRYKERSRNVNYVNLCLNDVHSIRKMFIFFTYIRKENEKEEEKKRKNKNKTKKKETK